MDQHDRIELERRLTSLEGKVEDLKDVPATLDQIVEKLTKYEARWGGITMVLSALLALVVAFKDEFIKRFF